MKKPLPHFCIWEKCWSLLQGKWWRLYCFKKWPKTRKSAACQQPVPREGTDVNTENCSNLPAEPISPSASSQSQENNQKCFPINKEKWERDGTLTDTFWNCWKRRGCATHSPRPKTHMSKMQCGECCRGGAPPLWGIWGWDQTDLRGWHVKWMGMDARIVHTLRHKQWGNFTEMHPWEWLIKLQCVCFWGKNAECSQTKKQNTFLLGDFML